MGRGSAIERVGRYWYFVDHLVPEEGAVVRLWVALPMDRPGQAVTLGSISPEPVRIHEDVLTGNRIACFEVRDPPAEGALAFTVDFEVSATEVRSRVDPRAVTDYDREGPEYLRFTRSEPWLETTDEIAGAARAAIDEETNPYLAARRIFDWVVREMSYEYPDMEDRGAAKSIARRKGDCGEFSAVFVAMCRSVGIPARTVTCNWFTGSGHQWAEFLCPPYGWIPVDASVAEGIRGGEESMAAFCENRGIPFDDPNWLFGNLYANRLVVFVGTNIEVGEKTFSLLQPGGVNAWPPAFEAESCGDGVAHGGFYLFDEGCDDPERARETVRRDLAKAYFDAGHMDQAEEGFRLAVAERPGNALAWFHLGQIHMDRGELQKSRDAFTDCIEGGAGSIQPVLAAYSLLLRGHCFDLEGRRDEAVADYEAIVATGVEFQNLGDQARKYIEDPFTGAP